MGPNSGHELRAEDIDARLFWAQVERHDDAACWAWLGCVNPRSGRPTIHSRARYGRPYRTMQALGMELGVSRERVRQLRNSALARIGAPLVTMPVTRARATATAA